MEVKTHTGDHGFTNGVVQYLYYIEVEKNAKDKIQLHFGGPNNGTYVLDERTASGLLDALLTIVWDKNSIDT